MVREKGRCFKEFLGLKWKVGVLKLQEELSTAQAGVSSPAGMGLGREEP